MKVLLSAEQLMISVINTKFADSGLSVISLKTRYNKYTPVYPFMTFSPQKVDIFLSISSPKIKRIRIRQKIYPSELESRNRVGGGFE